LKERAAIDVRLNRFSAAIANLDRATRLAPLDTELMYRRRIVLSRLGRQEEADKLQAQLDSFRKDEAELSKTREQLTLNPTSTDLRYKIARWMFDHGQDEEGIRWSKTILAAEPNHALTNRMLADHYEKRGNTGLANFYRFQATNQPPKGANP
jgi:predicted Zn-dependent protease